MAFWTDSGFEPKQNFKWKIVLNGLKAISFYATSVTKPNFQVKTKKFKLINIEETFPSNVTWSPVKITFIDSVDNYALESILNTFDLSGLEVDKNAIAHKGVSKWKPGAGISFLEIHALNNNGKTIEKWILYNAVPTQLEMSNLDYKSDDLSTYSLTLQYDWATVNEPIGSEDSQNNKTREQVKEEREATNPTPTNSSMTTDSDGKKQDDHTSIAALASPENFAGQTPLEDGSFSGLGDRTLYKKEAPIPDNLNP